MLSPLDTTLSVQLGRMPFKSANSYASAFFTHIMPVVTALGVSELVKNNLYCVLSAITALVNSSTSDKRSKRS